MRLVCSLFLFCLSLLPLSSAWAQLARIGTGGMSGVYYPVGGQLSLLFNRLIDADEYVVFAPKISGGTKQNIEELLNKNTQFALVQSNIATEVYQNGLANNTKEQDLRAIVSLYPEYVTVIARQGANIKTFSDLKGKNVNFGTRSSGSWLDMQNVLSALNLSTNSYKRVHQYSPDDAITALCYKDIDATVMTVGHPSSNFFRMIGQCGGQLVPFSSRQIDIIREKHPEYREVVVPYGTYKEQQEIKTVGLYALLVTRANQPEELVYRLTKQIFENLDTLRQSHPVLNHLDPKTMANEHFDIPIHPGAKKYFIERGLMSPEN